MTKASRRDAAEDIQGATPHATSRELTMEQEYTMAIHLLGALGAGALIGLERSFHGRPAGFRTHTLVCVTSSLLMLVTLYQSEWLPGVPLETVKMDPTRMAQGIMTGIGFLGAGVIYKEGATVRGVTTAASIWLTAAIGILFGIGFYFPALLATAFALGILAAFRWLEARMPAQVYAYHHIRFQRNNTMSEKELRDLLAQHGFSIANMAYRVIEDGQVFEYRMVIRTTDPTNTSRLADDLRQLELVREFRIAPTGD
jgi:putative Mg2+ transporter-C (MgtC) family protein